MTENIQMFRAYDIRVKHEAFSEASRVALARAVAYFFQCDEPLSSVIIARDARLYCPEMMEELIEALLSAGIEVYINPGEISTCQFYFMCLSNPSFGGIMITASHNPAEYIGLKLVGPGCTPIALGSGIEKIRDAYKEEKRFSTKARGSLHPLLLEEAYVDASMDLAGVEAGSLKGLSVYGDFLSGAAGADVLLALEKAGAKLTARNIIPDGFFPSGDPNPIIESSVAPSRKRMASGSFDLGFFFDGDGDRMDLMFPDGSQIIPTMNLAVLSPYIQKAYPDADLKCFVDSKAAPPLVIEIARNGMKPYLIRNGHSFIKAKLKSRYSDGFRVAVEESAHYYLTWPLGNGEVAATENTLFFLLLTMRALKESPESYARTREIQSRIFREREWSLAFDEPEMIDKVLGDVGKAIEKRGAIPTDTMDDGSPLGALLMRYGVDSELSRESKLASSWWQVSQRISQSEDAKARWEVSASSEALCRELNEEIRAIADSYVKKGIAHYA